MRSDVWMRIWAVAASTGVLWSVGCARSVREASVADTLGGVDMMAELDFWDQLAAQDAVTNHDALHALLLTFEFLSEEGAVHEGERVGAALQGGADFEAKAGFARSRGWIPAGGTLVADETTQAGWIARAICLEAGIEGGLNMRLFGPVPRYALRELTYERLMGSKSENQALSGLELIATLGRVQDRRTGLVSAPRQDF